jgi:hypothetical protein
MQRLSSALAYISLPRATCLLAAVALGALATLTSSLPMAAETEKLVPDFYMNGFGWHSRQANFMPPTPDVAGIHGPIGDHPDYPHQGNNNFGAPVTDRIGDDTSPLLQPWAAEITRKANVEVLAGGIPFRASSRCWPPGVPGILGFTVEPQLFLQTPDEVVMIHQRGQVVRHVYLNRKHPEDLERSWMGHSIGHYEGDTLVVDTIGLNDKTYIGNFPIPHSEQLHVVERYRIVPGSPDLLTDNPRPTDDPYFINPDNKVQQVIAWIEDPGAFIAPYTVMQLYELDTGRFEERICQENNGDRFNQGLVPVPTDDTPDF